VDEGAESGKEHEGREASHPRTVTRSPVPKSG
jgi:hypothetical protein